MQKSIQSVDNYYAIRMTWTTTIDFRWTWLLVDVKGTPMLDNTKYENTQSMKPFNCHSKLFIPVQNRQHIGV